VAIWTRAAQDDVVVLAADGGGDPAVVALHCSGFAPDNHGVAMDGGDDGKDGTSESEGAVSQSAVADHQQVVVHARGHHGLDRRFWGGCDGGVQPPVGVQPTCDRLVVRGLAGEDEQVRVEQRGMT
jgi:hypothetical protein